MTQLILQITAYTMSIAAILISARSAYINHKAMKKVAEAMQKIKEYRQMRLARDTDEIDFHLLSKWMDEQDGTR